MLPRYFQLISSMRQSQVHIVTLRWGVWSLSKNLPPSGSLLNVPIIGGPGLNPEKKLVFTSDYGPVSLLRRFILLIFQSLIYVKS